MKKMKRILAGALAGMMLFSAMPAMSLNAEEANIETEVQEEVTSIDENIVEESAEEETVIADENECEEENVIIEEEIKLNYLYISQNTLASDDVQDIVVSWGDGTENVENVELWYQINGEPAGFIELENKGSGLFLYQNSFEDVGTYYFTCVSVAADGQEYDYFLDEIGIDAAFDVYDETEDDIPGVAVIETEDVENAQAEEIVSEALEEVAADSGVSISTYTLDNDSSDGELVIALDPGHDATHAGAQGNGIKEEVATLKIAQYCKAELEKYAGVRVYMCRDSAACPYPGTTSTNDIVKRVEASVAEGADIYVSIHLNSSVSSAAKGAEVWYPDSSQTPNTTAEGKALSEKIQAELVSLGLYNRGAQETDNNFTCMREGGKYDLPAIIIEHAFVSNASDASNYLSSDAKLKKLGVADAQGIVEFYGLSLKTDADVDSELKIQAHVQNYGWMSWTGEGELVGTTGESLRLEALKIKLSDDLPDGDIEYRVHVQNKGWTEWKKNGEIAGTIGESLRIEAIQVRLTGDIAEEYGLVYKSHVQDFGWLDEVCTNEMSGSEGYSKRLECFEIEIKPLSEIEESTGTGFIKKCASTVLEYSGHVQNIGDVKGVLNGAILGTTGKSLRIEGLTINLDTDELGVDGGLEYRAHVQNYGWMDWVSNGEFVGTKGESKRIEALKIKLTGEAAEKYDIYYRCHVQNVGWMGWAKNGAMSGTSGASYRIEAVQILIQPKGVSAPGTTSNCYRAWK